MKGHKDRMIEDDLLAKYTDDDYAVYDMKEKKFLSKILISADEAKKFYNLCTNKDKRLIKFGWRVVL